MTPEESFQQVDSEDSMAPFIDEGDCD